MSPYPTPAAAVPAGSAATDPGSPRPARSLAAALPPPGAPVLLQGWIHRTRVLRAVVFLVLRDRSGTVQCVITDDALRAQVAGWGEESVVTVQGTVVDAPQAPGGREIRCTAVDLVGEPAQTPPLELWRPRLTASLPVQLDHAALAWRHPARGRTWRIAAAAMAGFRRVLDADGFVEIRTPKIVAGSTESGATVFEVDWFGRPAYLAQSPQFSKQVLVGAFERVYEVGPVFRAEPHDTARHLAEYTSLDVELGFIRDHLDVLAVLHRVLTGMLAATGALGVPAPRLPAAFPVVHFSRALELVGADPGEPDLAPEHERALGEWAAAEHASDFVAVTGYPAAKRPFYTHPQPDDPRWTNSFDLLFRGLELVTGGQRLHRLADYEHALRARGEDPADHEGYLAAFRHGMPPHGGFAIGLERFVGRLLELPNIREATLFPRDLHRITP